MSIRRAVQSAFLDAGLTLEKEALSAFVAFVEERGGEQQLVFSLLDAAVTGAAWRSPSGGHPGSCTGQPDTCLQQRPVPTGCRITASLLTHCAPGGQRNNTICTEAKPAPCHAECASSTKITREQAQIVISALCGTSRRTEPVQVISAFDVPRVQYDPIRKIFYQQPTRASLHGSAEARPCSPCGW